MSSYYMKYECPACGGSRTKSPNGGTFINRDRFGGWYRHRRRVCQDCGCDFQTYEVMEDDFKLLQDAKKYGVHKVRQIHKKQKSKWEKDRDNQS